MTTNFNLPCSLAPDVAFFEPNTLLINKKENTALVGIYNYTELENSFGSKETDKNAYYQKWKNIVSHYREIGLQVSLFYTTVSDAEETRCFQQYLAMQQFHVTIVETNSLHELNQLLETAGKVYSARMHALILAFKKGCQVEVFEISQKLKSFKEDYIDAKNYPEVISQEVNNTFVDNFTVLQKQF